MSKNASTIKRVLQEQKLRLSEQEEEKKKKDDEKEDKKKEGSLASDMADAALDVTPVLGTYRSGVRAKDAYEKGEYGKAALHGGLTALSAAGDLAIASGVGSLAGAGLKALVGAGARKLAGSAAQKAAAGETGKVVAAAGNKPAAAPEAPKAPKTETPKAKPAPEMPKFDSSVKTNEVPTQKPANDLSAPKESPAQKTPKQPKVEPEDLIPPKSKTDKKANDNKIDGEEVQGAVRVKTKIEEPPLKEPFNVKSPKDLGITKPNQPKPSNDNSGVKMPKFDSSVKTNEIPKQKPANDTAAPKTTPIKDPLAAPAAKPAAKPVPAAQPVVKPAVKPAAQPAAQPATKLAAEPAAKPAPKQGKKETKQSKKRIIPPLGGGNIPPSIGSWLKNTHGNKTSISRAKSRIVYEAEVAKTIKSVVKNKKDKDKVVVEINPKLKDIAYDIDE